jgi:hypothetical protein
MIFTYRNSNKNRGLVVCGGGDNVYEDVFVVNTIKKKYNAGK